MAALRLTGAAALLLAISCAAAFSQRTVNVNLERMVKQSGAIVHATVAGVTSAKDGRSKYPVTTVTLTVKENFFGAPEQTYTFRQLGGRANGIAFIPAGMPQYRVGQEVIVMLYAPSDRGLQSPVGAGQGVFTVKADDRSGVKRVANAHGNRDLFKGMTQKAGLAKLTSPRTKTEELQLDDFSQAIRSLVQTLKQ